MRKKVFVRLLCSTDIRGLVISKGKMSFVELQMKNDITDHYFFRGGTCIRRDMFTGQFYHLYFVSNDTIKKGDWLINKNGDTLYQLKEDVTPDVYKFFDKVVATTNPKLYPKNLADIVNNPIGRIGDDFVNAYIVKFNKREPIEEVMLDYVNNSPHLRPKGTVVISPVKERLYTREQFKYAVRQAWIHSCGIVVFEDWFEQNFPETH